MKPAERLRDSLPKVETVDPKFRRQGGLGTLSVYNVGVIPASASCPAGVELVTFYMDDEDHNNANTASGWIGATVANNNTRIYFCKEDGTNFHNLNVAPFAVLQLSPQCPPGSSPFSRYFDNEDDQNQNGYAGTISPNDSQFYPGSYTTLHFCLFAPDPCGGGANSFPNLGMQYGVFASNLSVLGMANGHLHIDDEDDSNQDGFDAGYFALGSVANQIISGTTNTDISIVRVK